MSQQQTFNTSGPPVIPLLQNIIVQTGITPVLPTAGSITFNGAVVSAGTNPVQTDGTGVSVMALQVQLSQAIASSDMTKVGLANFDSADFTVDANGFVQLSGSSTLSLTPDSGGAVDPIAGNINVTGVTATDTNFETFNGGPGILQIVHRYQGQATTSDGGGQTQTILTIPVTVASTMNIIAQLAGIEATPLGVGGEINGTAFRGSGGATLLGVPDKVVRASATLATATFDITTSGNNLIVTVTGVTGFTIEWRIIAEIVLKSFI